METPRQTVDPHRLETLIEESKASGGAELANAQPFIISLCGLLGLDAPDFSKEENQFNNYVFERRVDFKHADGSTSQGRIDLYKKDCFVLEAKQSAKRKKDNRQLTLLGEEHNQKKSGTAKRGTGGWDKSCGPHVNLLTHSEMPSIKLATYVRKGRS